MDAEQFYAEALIELRVIRSLLEERRPRGIVPVRQGALDLVGDGFAAALRAPRRERAERTKPEADEWGNHPSRGLSLDVRPGKSPGWAVSYTPRGGKPMRCLVHFTPYGERAFSYARTVLAIYRGEDVPENLERLPSALRVRVARQVYVPR